MDLKEKVKMSEDDIKTLFYVLDENEKGYITIKEI